MALFGWDWGNVPSWFSAASFSAAGFVILRDRTIRTRQQVNQIGAWGKFTASPTTMRDDSSGSLIYEFRPSIDFRNSSDLPVTLHALHYSMTWTWDLPNSGANGQLRSVSRKQRAVHRMPTPETIPPGSTVALDLSGRMTTPEPEPGSRLVEVKILQVDKTMVVDNSGRTWSVEPGSGKLPKRVSKKRFQTPGFLNRR
jgi:hypothetical protein